MKPAGQEHPSPGGAPAPQPAPLGSAAALAGSSGAPRPRLRAELAPGAGRSQPVCRFRLLLAPRSASARTAWRVCTPAATPRARTPRLEGCSVPFVPTPSSEATKQRGLPAAGRWRGGRRRPPGDTTTKRRPREQPSSESAAGGEVLRGLCSQKPLGAGPPRHTLRERAPVPKRARTER